MKTKIRLNVDIYTPSNQKLTGSDWELFSQTIASLPVDIPNVTAKATTDLEAGRRYNHFSGIDIIISGNKIPTVEECEKEFKKALCNYYQEEFNEAVYTHLLLWKDLMERY